MSGILVGMIALLPVKAPHIMIGLLRHSVTNCIARAPDKRMWISLI
jgi:hypothetical protein